MCAHIIKPVKNTQTHTGSQHHCTHRTHTRTYLPQWCSLLSPHPPHPPTPFYHNHQSHTHVAMIFTLARHKTLHLCMLSMILPSFLSVKLHEVSFSCQSCDWWLNFMSQQEVGSKRALKPHNYRMDTYFSHVYF